MAPTPQQITVALEALRADADLWQRATTDMRTAATTAAGQRVEPVAFSFAAQSVATAYESLRAKLTALIEAGASNFDSITHALRSTAASYAADEAANAHHLQSIY